MHLLSITETALTLLFFQKVEHQAIMAIPSNADYTEVPDARTRLFPDPVSPESTDSGTTDELWQEIVVPDLKEQFSHAINTVIGDLRNFAQKDYSLRDLLQAKKELHKSSFFQHDEDDDLDEEEEEEEADKDDTVQDEPDEDEEDESGDTILHAYQLTIPMDHMTEWYSAMNQARLVMAEKSIIVADNGELHGPVLVRVTYEIYTQLQSLLMEFMK